MRHMLLIAALLTAHAGTALANDAEILAANFMAADTNGDQALDPAEFTAFVDLGAAAGLGRLPQVQARGLYDRAFDRLDQDGNRAVTPDELQAVAH